jgi:putative sigma-54 modulation protein
VEITVSARHTTVSDALREAVVEKIGRLSRFLEGMDRAEVHFSEERNRRIADKEVCEVTLEGHGHHVRCKVTAHDGFVAIDKAVAKLEHQLHKLKTQLLRRQHGGRSHVHGNGVAEPRSAVAGSSLAAADGAAAAATAVVEAEVDTDVDRDPTPRIVKVKRHALWPMTPEEAVLRLELVGHDFWFFTNAETGRAAVLYRRADGDLGLIDEAE